MAAPTAQAAELLGTQQPADDSPAALRSVASDALDKILVGDSPESEKPAGDAVSEEDDPLAPKGEKSPEGEKKLEEEKKPEDEEIVKARSEIAEERKRIADMSEKAQKLHASASRRAKAAEEREAQAKAKLAEIEAKEAEILKLDSVVDVVRFVAKRGGVTEQDVWQDIADQLRNDGKRSRENESARELKELALQVREEREALRKEREEQSSKAEQERKAREAAEQQAKEAEIEQQWKSETAEVAASNPSRWGNLSRYFDIGAAALSVVEQYHAKTGIVASREEVLDYLESQAAARQQPAATPATAKPNVGVAPKAKAKTISNSDAASSVDLRDMSPQEREALARRELEAFLDA